MDAKFVQAVESLHPKFEQLMASPPHSPGAHLPQRGVYVFLEGGQALYVGRSNNIPRRFRDHRGKASGSNKAAFAMLIARRKLGLTADYHPGSGTRTNLSKQREFAEAFCDAKERIRAMEFHAVGEDDQMRQALLEIYCAVALAAPYNDFGTH